MMRRLLAFAALLALCAPAFGQSIGPIQNPRDPLALHDIAGQSNKFVSSVAAGVATLTQPSCGNLTGAAASCGTNGTEISSGTVAQARLPVHATVQGTTQTVTPNSTASQTMAGFNAAITPTATGSLLICFSGWVTNSATTAGEGVTIQISYGTGTAPTANATLTGTQVGATVSDSIATTATAAINMNAPVSVCSIATGLTVSTAYWTDVAVKGLVNTSNTVHGAISAAEVG